MICSKCGGDIIGDGFNSPMHCENVDCPIDRECDANILECNYMESNKIIEGIKTVQKQAIRFIDYLIEGNSVLARILWIAFILFIVPITVICFTAAGIALFFGSLIGMVLLDPFLWIAFKKTPFLSFFDDFLH